MINSKTVKKGESMYRSLNCLFMLVVIFVLASFGISGLAAQAQAYTWKDGDRLHIVYLNSNFIAEIQSSIGSKPEKHSRILPLTDTKLKSALEKGFLPKTHQGSHSEVFEEGEGGRKMTLPGDIFVEFAEGWDEQKVKEWASNEQLILLGKLNSQKNIYRIQTLPGIESLVLANRLLSQTGVKSAFPNWWRESVRR